MSKKRKSFFDEPDELKTQENEEEYLKGLPEDLPSSEPEEKENILVDGGDSAEEKVNVKVKDAEEPICVCGHPKSFHGLLHGNIKNEGMCEIVNCSCQKFQKGS